MKSTNLKTKPSIERGSLYCTRLTLLICVLGISALAAGQAAASGKSSAVTTSGGKVGAVPYFSTPTNIQSSHISDSGGIVNISEPLSALSVNGVINPLVCGQSTPPTWCSGSDVGSWINAAIHELPGNGTATYGCGIVQLPYQSSLSFSAQIVKPQCTIIDLNQSTIEFTPSTAGTAAIWVGDSFTGGPPMPGGIKNGRIFGNTGQNTSQSWGILLGDSSSSPTKYATNQTFYDLDVQNFLDDFVIGSNAYSDTWVGGIIALSGEAGIHFKGFSGLTNEGENFSFHGTNFGNAQLHDVLVDTGALAEVNASGTSFDYAGGQPGATGCSPSIAGSDSISSSGILFFNASSSHFERCLGAKFINCSGECSVAVSNSEMFLSGNVATTDAFGEFAPNSNASNASFLGVDFENISAGSNSLQQLFVWGNGNGSLDLFGFRNVFSPVLSGVALYSGSAPQGHFDSRATGLAGHANCWKAGGQIGYCSTGLNSSGVCTCN
jgi:hypothetical protein